MEGIFIFVLDRGHIVVGRVKIHPKLPLHWHFSSSRTIRRWGTTKGLAELKDGPTKDTVLDEVVERSTPFRGVLDIQHVTEKGAKAWAKVL